MKKIQTLYVRDPDNRDRVTDQVTPGCEWVIAGEGVPTRKYDGTCMLLDDDGRWWARRMVRDGRTPPPEFVPVDSDSITGKTFGWEPVEQSSYVKQWREAVQLNDPLGMYPWKPGTYELIGPKVGTNAERIEYHDLVRHADAQRFDPDGPLDPGSLITMCRVLGHEGIVWHHPDGRMAKLKVKDYPA